MPGLEVVVRPVVFPDIRPIPAQSVAPLDDPAQGIAEITGSGGQLIDLPQSLSRSWSRQHTKETKRKFDVVRVYQVEKPKKINKDNYVDLEALRKLWNKDGQEVESTSKYEPVPVKTGGNIELLRQGIIRLPEEGPAAEPSGGDRPSEGGGGA